MARRGRPWVLAGLVACAAAGPHAPRLAHADPLAGVEEARQLFADALADERAQLFQRALDKFRRVQQFRDTAPVRYRIGACLEGLGLLVEARDAYRAAASAGEREADQGRLVEAARARAAALDGRVSFLAVGIAERPGDAPVSLQVDGVRTSAADAAQGRGLAVSPGRHVVVVEAPGAAPYRSEVSLPEGGHVALVVRLGAAASTGSTTGAEIASPARPEALSPAPAEAAPASPPARSPVGTTIGWIALGTGAALGVASAVTLAIREADARALVEACARGCPESRRDELTSLDGRARTLGPVGAALGVAGVGALGVGGYLLLVAPRARTAPRTQAQIHPGVAAGGPSLLVSGVFP